MYMCKIYHFQKLLHSSNLIKIYRYFGILLEILNAAIVILNGKIHEVY